MNDRQIWYLAKNGKKSGPFTAAMLKGIGEAGHVTPGMLVWREGLAAWAAVETVKGLTITPLPAAPAAAQEPLPAVARRTVEYRPQSPYAPLVLFLAVTVGVAFGGFLAIEGAKRYAAYQVKTAVAKVAKEIDSQVKKEAAAWDAASQAMRRAEREMAR